VKTALWLVCALLLAVVAFAVYQAFQSPAFVAGLMSLAAAAAAKAIIPVVTKPLSADDTKAKNEAARGADAGDNWIRKRLGSLRDR
jgi:hypothetical protein